MVTGLQSPFDSNSFCFASIVIHKLITANVFSLARNVCRTKAAHRSHIEVLLTPGKTRCKKIIKRVFSEAHGLRTIPTLNTNLNFF